MPNIKFNQVQFNVDWNQFVAQHYAQPLPNHVAIDHIPGEIHLNVNENGRIQPKYNAKRRGYGCPTGRIP